MSSTIFWTSARIALTSLRSSRCSGARPASQRPCGTRPAGGHQPVRSPGLYGTPGDCASFDAGAVRVTSTGAFREKDIRIGGSRVLPGACCVPDDGGNAGRLDVGVGRRRWRRCVECGAACQLPAAARHRHGGRAGRERHDGAPGDEPDLACPDAAHHAHRVRTASASSTRPRWAAGAAYRRRST